MLSPFGQLSAPQHLCKAQEPHCTQHDRESRSHSWEDGDARRTTDHSKAPIPAMDPLTHLGCSHTPMGALSHSQPCSSTQGSLYLVVTVTV